MNPSHQMLKSEGFFGATLTARGLNPIGVITRGRTLLLYDRRARELNPALGSRFSGPLKVWAEHYTAGLLRFRKWGEIDRISNYPADHALFVDVDRKKPLSMRKVNSTFRAMGFTYLACRISPTIR